MFKELALIGTTASGKSDLAIKIANEKSGVILSLDSLSIYKKIDIASAKPSKEELASTRHFGIDLVLPNEYFSVGEFIKEYKRAKDFASNANVPLIITGGSGFYLKAMINGLAPKIANFKSDLNNAEIFAIAEKKDPKFAAKFSQNDTYRLQKWYSIYHATNEIPSDFLAKNTSAPIIKNLKIFEISTKKEILNQKIAARTAKMIEAGILNEAKFLFENYSGAKPLGSIGLKECGELLHNTGEFEAEILKREFSRAKKIAKILNKTEILEFWEISPQNFEYFFNSKFKNSDDFELFKLAKLANLITIHTAQLAKRQRTFNRSFKDKISASNEILEVEIFKFLS